VANQRSGTVVVLRRDEVTGRLSPAGKQLTVAAPVCLRFRAHVGVTT
jgi:6-phosphogluconolactonase (cycloisomerase 2 family)